MFTPTSMEIRAEVFAFVLQLQFAQSNLNRLRELDCELLLGRREMKEAKLGWEIRQQLGWFIASVITFSGRSDQD